jgi:hypothetical protein
MKIVLGANGRSGLPQPYKVEDTRPGPADVAGVTFRHGNTLVEMSVTCSGGTPSATTTTRER